MKLKEASDIAVSLCYRLQPFCDRLNIAGSIRRRKSEVKDIEIVAQAKMVAVPSQDLFATDMNMVKMPEFIKEVESLGVITKGKSDGKYIAITLPEGISLDLFMPAPFDYYRQYAIRTGSADYAARIIAGGWVAKGWCGSDVGLRLQKDCYKKETPDGKGRWICNNPNAQHPPAWESEAEFFNWIGVRMPNPIYRNI